MLDVANPILVAMKNREEETLNVKNAINTIYNEMREMHTITRAANRMTSNVQKVNRQIEKVDHEHSHFSETL